jgi:dTDP-4-amino-4,6-dideoxygalactose transaminase
VDSDFYTLQPNQLKEVLTKKTKAVIAVHLYGQGADLSEIIKFCNEKKLFLIEDVSQAHGAKWNGKNLGGFGDIACYSCYPTKNLGAIGDAGLITTNNEKLSKRIKMLREYGWQKRYVSEIIGRNSRLDEIQAAILRIKLRNLDNDNFKRQLIGNYYSKKINKNHYKTPVLQKNMQHVYHLYVIRTKLRDQLMEHLNKEGIQSLIHYPMPIHLQPAYKNRVRTASNMSVTENIAKEVLSLPMYPELLLSEVERVIDAVNSFNNK